jgi:hypothetical protein
MKMKGLLKDQQGSLTFGMAASVVAYRLSIMPGCCSACSDTQVADSMFGPYRNGLIMRSGYEF